jgi:hypothetical protein
MQSVKEMARELIEHLPDTATFDDLMYEFYVRQKIETVNGQLSEQFRIEKELNNLRLQEIQQYSCSSSRQSELMINH